VKHLLFDLNMLRKKLAENTQPSLGSNANQQQTSSVEQPTQQQQQQTSSVEQHTQQNAQESAVSEEHVNYYLVGKTNPDYFEATMMKSKIGKNANVTPKFWTKEVTPISIDDAEARKLVVSVTAISTLGEKMKLPKSVTVAIGKMKFVCWSTQEFQNDRSIKSAVRWDFGKLKEGTLSSKVIMEAMPPRHDFRAVPSTNL
jgi:hypothetical protein